MKSTLLMTLVIGLFLAMLFLNFYFRVKVLKVYKRLVRDRVQFGAAHMFNKKKMEEEIYPQYPDHVEDIKTFVSHIFYSLRIASILIVLITLAGLLLRQ
jgi:hypothetical protein